ncbi:hypothetical protein DLAC_03077 [Tieghemostelium lacteum]|uniref:PiggyBac transposable element-derived protein domain-containing protein n=1 Tax=Tieghemostelium lacteum TaxID=361077 RepID=A0A152A2K1_TIELA|nr:hypothetical protein DLAC_03077 [Tieghemostelium lacteum]|eukprot:KYR00335.1 hypothetical protein DLAC_03077 [Tieghemostelium lacteum]
MSRDQFRLLRRVIHLCDNNNKKFDDKFFKVRRFMQNLQTNLKENYYPEQNNSIDEDIIACRSRVSMIQFLPLKPKRFGFRIWKIVDEGGVCHDFDIYQGKNSVERKEKAFNPLGEEVVIDLIKNLSNNNNHVIYIDNYFTSIELVK